MEIRLQNILFPNAGICDVAELYYHEESSSTAFDGYFNLFYIEKRKAYTNISGVSLFLELTGCKTITLYHDREKLREISLEQKDDPASLETSLQKYTFDFPWEEYDTGVFWFALEKENPAIQPAEVVKGFFQGHINREEVRDVVIGIDICTYRRETYIERNLGALSRRFFAQKADGQAKQMKQTEQTEKTEDSVFDISRHLWVYVIDNGQTLDKNNNIRDIVRDSQGRIRILPNKNSGGAGGFTRGMLEILNDRERLGLTHVLLMDDDAVIEPDTLVRIYGLLCTRKEEWLDITVGGTMLREEYPYILYCAGERWHNGVIIDTDINLDVRDFANASSKYLTTTSHEYSHYSGWWCCCYSLNTVRRDNLPLPLFLHHDDIEFGLRNHNRGVVFLNGIGVWHRGSGTSFPGTNLYYDMRNNLIEIALHQKVSPKNLARKLAFKVFVLSLFRLKYRDAEMTYRGIADFLKGPAWLYKQDPEALNTEIRAMNYQMRPLSELAPEPSASRETLFWGNPEPKLPRENTEAKSSRETPEATFSREKQKAKQVLTGKEFASVSEQIRHITENQSMNALLAAKKIKKSTKLFSWLTCNGWIFPADRENVAVLTPIDSPYKGFRKGKIVLYEPGSGNACLLQKDWRMFFKTVLLYARAACALEKGFDAAAESWRKNAGRLGNAEAWKKYLK